MRVLLFGATGMVGQGVLRECLLDPDVTEVLAVGRSVSGQAHEKLKELVLKDFFDVSAVADRLSRHDACFFCLGVSSAGMKEEDYRRVTYDLTLGVARLLAARNSGMTFIYVSGAGTDGTGQSRAMWARVKGETENALVQLRFHAAYMFRPAFIQPLHGITSKTKWYRILYAVSAPLYPVWKRLLPRYVSTTEQIGRAMINAAKRGAPKRVLEVPDINALSV